jgi:hypothetical protein
MATTASRDITITYYGDVGGASPGVTQEISAANNLASPAQIQIVTLASGDNTITVPGGGTTPKACTIVKPSDNATAIKIKGAGGDTGIRLHDTDPDTISLHSGVASFILNAGAEVVGVRLWWT